MCGTPRINFVPRVAFNLSLSLLAAKIKREIISYRFLIRKGKAP